MKRKNPLIRASLKIGEVFIKRSKAFMSRYFFSSDVFKLITVLLRLLHLLGLAAFYKTTVFDTCLPVERNRPVSAFFVTETCSVYRCSENALQKGISVIFSDLAVGEVRIFRYL